MIDPKMLELSVYNGIPHLLTPVVTDPQKAVGALNWVVAEMEERYKRMAKLSVRNIEAFNGRLKSAAERGEQLARTVQTGFDSATGQPIYEREEMDLAPMAYIVVVVDEFADLMITAGKDIETAVQRLAQKARAAGIHLIMATQRPSVDIITGTIKANFPTRISFKVASKIDSRTILNEQGAEQLLGQGDMLYTSGAGQMLRVHGPFVSDEEVEAVAAYLRTQGAPRYIESIADAQEESSSAGSGSAGGGADEGESLYDRAVAVVLRDRKASTSYVQRRLSIGYNRAADLIERMEREGLISAPNHTGRREILAGDGPARSIA
jgi:S-DNA-T family DNA segregation ATPase FtsK/SpoIIIE